MIFSFFPSFSTLSWSFPHFLSFFRSFFPPAQNAVCLHGSVWHGGLRLSKSELDLIIPFWWPETQGNGGGVRENKTPRCNSHGEMSGYIWTTVFPFGLGIFCKSSTGSNVVGGGKWLDPVFPIVWGKSRWLRYILKIELCISVSRFYWLFFINWSWNPGRSRMRFNVVNLY